MCLIGSHCLISQGSALAVGGQHSAHLADDALHFLIVRCLHRIQSAASRQCNGDFARLCLLRLRQRLVFCLCPGNAAVQLRLSARLDTVQLLQQRLDLRLVGSFLFTGRGRRFFCGRSSAGAGCAGSVLLLAGRGRIAALRLGARAPRGSGRTCFLLRSTGRRLLFPAAGCSSFAGQLLQRDLAAEQLIQIIIRQGELCAVRRGIRQGFRQTGCHAAKIEQYTKDSCCQQCHQRAQHDQHDFQDLIFLHIKIRCPGRVFLRPGSFLLTNWIRPTFPKTFWADAGSQRPAPDHGTVHRRCARCGQPSPCQAAFPAAALPVPYGAGACPGNGCRWR